MAQVPNRIDQLPMRRVGYGALSQESALYEIREIDPLEPDTPTRRAGSERQAQYSRAAGFAAPLGSYWRVDADSISISGSAFTVAMQVAVGSIQEASGTVTLLEGQRVTNFLSGARTNYVRIWLDKAVGGVYSVKAQVYDVAGTGGLPSILSVSTGVAANTDISLALYTDGAMTGTPTVTLNVGGTTDSGVLNSGTYNLTDSTITILGPGAAPEGDLTVIDPINIYTSDVSADGLASMVSRTPTTPADIQINCDSAAPVAPGTGIGDMFPYPSKPLVSGSDLRFSGASGCVRVGYNSVFDRFFESNLSNTVSKVFAFKIKFTRDFITDKKATTLFEFPGFAKLTLDTSGNPIFTYSDQAAWTTTGLATTEDIETTLWIGCDGTYLFVYDGSASDTETETANKPFLDYRRTPDLFIGADEDQTSNVYFHGKITEFKIFDYAATSDDGEPIFDLDPARLEDRSQSRLALSAEPHATISALPVLAPGPVQDASHQAILSGSVLTPSGIVGTTSTLPPQHGPMTNAATGVKIGDRLFISEPGGALVVEDTRRNQLRPLGLPEIGQEISARRLGVGGLDGVYQHGVRFVSGDGTYGPIRRLNPVKALGGASVLLGSSSGTGSNGDDGETELGESYGKTNSGYENFFRWDGGTLTDSGADGNSVEVFAAFPNFSDLEEQVFDRGSTYISSGSKKTAWCAFPAGLQLDFTEDFTIGISFKFDKTVVSGDGTSEHQCLFSIGHNDPEPWTRPFMVMLYKDSGGWGGGSYRLVASRCTGRRDNRYTAAAINDSADFTWTDGKQYTVVAVRRGDDLELHVHDVEGTGDWFHYTTPATGPYVGKSLVGFFDGSNNFGHKGSATYLHYGAAALREEGGDTGNQCAENFPRVKTDGTMDTGNLQVIGALSSDTTWYHARAWSTSYGKAAIQQNFEERFAGDDEMSHKLISDVAFISDDPSEEPKQFYDRKADVYWNVYAEDSTTSAITNPSKSRFEQARGTDITNQYAMVVSDSAENNAEEAELQLFATSIGNGSIILSTGVESFTLSTKQWDEASFSGLALGDLQIDVEGFNCYTATVDLVTSGTEYEISVRDFSVNGNEVFNEGLTGPSTPTLTKANFRIWLGGFNAYTNTEDTHIGEFRWWSDNRYNDSDEAYDYVGVRVKDRETMPLYIYAKFQPADENDPVDGLMDDHGTVLTSNAWVKKSDAGAWDGTNDAEIIDGRDLADDDIDSPAPAVAFPLAPYPHITGFELFRTNGKIIKDPNDDVEIDKAIKNVDGKPLRFLARIPIGERSFTDTTLDATLGEAIRDSAGFVPEDVQGVFIWNDRLGIFDEGNLFMAAPGPFGWESFESFEQYSVPNQGLSDIVAAVSYASALAVFGSDWGTVLTGDPANPRPYYLGGVGAQSARAVIPYAGYVYVLGDGTLWRITPPSGLSAPTAEDFGLVVDDKLPANGRLAVSAIENSLYIIDEDTGETLRFHFATQRWSVEDRDALSIGDLSTGLGVVHLGSGSYSVKNTTLTGDDLNASTTQSTTGTLATGALTMSDPDAPVGTRVLVVDSAGASVYTTVTSYTDGDLVTADSLAALADGTVNVDFGIPEEGWLYDTGWYSNPTGFDLTLSTLRTGVISGTGYQVALDGQASPGTRSTASTTYTDIGTDADSNHQGTARGRWVRARIRNRKAEASVLDQISLVHDLEQ